MAGVVRQRSILDLGLKPEPVASRFSKVEAPHPGPLLVWRGEGEGFAAHLKCGKRPGVRRCSGTFKSGGGPPQSRTLARIFMSPRKSRISFDGSKFDGFYKASATL